LQTVQPPRF